MMQELEPILSSMTPISLGEMSAVKLMNRVDSKFPTNMGTMLRMAPLWNTHFYVQEVDGQRIAHYRTLYFDTPDAVTYTMHHNRRLHRQKVRQRIYVDSGVAFCEIKNKKNTGRTKKKRIPIPMEEWGDLYQLPEMAEFIREKVWVTDRHLSPRLENAFQRITLVNKAKTERITIDFGITFHNHVSGCDADVSDLVIIEVKQDGSLRSRFKDILRNARVQRKGLSKYCLGMLRTDEHLKYNRFKDKIRFVNKLTNKNHLIKSLEQ
ncbi:MAG: polyphosphate polymerase domain-containing protein [Bacteroidales bacterium]|nr:polyphosphate polymerase domain-containing protein [Bacteroidales bacterium]